MTPTSITDAPPSYTICVCGKRGFPSRHAALEAQRHNGHKVRVYRCGRYWHVTKEAKLWR